ncbi:hypothetical protein F5Y03DRAFT_46083 [Xylaria venustula]|nr:hypothetical protein F5Y03DRAFT_46083 [Xylaria venustula]
MDKSTDLLSLHKFSDRKATNEQDKVYALLGLATQKNLFAPDYSFSINALYEKTAVVLIRTHRNLAALCGDIKRRNSQSLTSWAPDWCAILEKPDRERMVLQSVYNACSDWRVAVFETAEEYWVYVAEQMDLLVQDMQSRPPRRLSQYLKHSLILYQQCLEDCAAFPLPGDLNTRLSQSCSAILHHTNEYRYYDSPAPSIAKMIVETEECLLFQPFFEKAIIETQKMEIEYRTMCKQQNNP